MIIASRGRGDGEPPASIWPVLRFDPVPRYIFWKFDMKIDVNERSRIRLTEVFEPIELVSTNGEILIVCLRNGGFELAIQDFSPVSPENEKFFSWYAIRNGNMEPLLMLNKT